MTALRHIWVRGSGQHDRAAYVARLDLPAPLPGAATVDAHRRLRGPYTAMGTLARALVPAAYPVWPDRVSRHDIELLTVAPELRAIVSASRETLTSLAVPSERTRFYSPARTLRLAHGVVEFVRDHVTHLDGGPFHVLIDQVDEADPTDAEAIAVLLRRVDPRVLRLVIGTGPTALPAQLRAALDEFADVADAAGVVDAPAGEHVPRAGDPSALAQAYVEGDCLYDDPVRVAAYRGLPGAARAALHDARADDLAARGETSLELGAIAFHRERGSDPAGAGARALRRALEYCLDHGFYHATIDLGRRGRAVVDVDDLDMYWAFTTKMTSSLAALGRAAEAEQLYWEARAATSSTQIHMQAAYATAMLYTRHHDVAQRDDDTAKGWINLAIAMSAQLPERKERAARSVFNKNGLALIEVHRGDLPEALRLVDEGLAHLDAELGGDEHRLHRSVLRHNRAQVYQGLGRLDEALADYSAVIAADPNYAEYYFDRAGLLRQLGRTAEALADYERTIRLSAPFAEAYYNRADLRWSSGDPSGALVDFDYVLELDPDCVDAYLNRSGLLAAMGDFAGAWRDSQRGLVLEPGSALLLCAAGVAAAGDGDGDRALRAFDAALTADPAMQLARLGRAGVLFDRHEFDAALDELDQAIGIEDNVMSRYNRAIVLAAAGRDFDAVADLERALELAPGDADSLLARDRLRTGAVI